MLKLKEIKIGTRKSPLALWQTNHVVSLLKRKHPKFKITVVEVTTAGDRDRDSSLSSIGGSGLFTAEIESDLLNGKFDIAVHSYKDLATVLPVGLEIGAVLPREESLDVFITKDLDPFDKLRTGAIIGTSSLRRRAMLMRLRDDIEVVNLRGNVHTRLNSVGFSFKEGKQKTKKIDGTVMAAAGLNRLGLATYAVNLMNKYDFVPAPAQGAIAIEIRSNDKEIKEIIGIFNHKPSSIATLCERTFLNIMEGGCQLPLGAFAEVDSSFNISCTAMVLSLDGKDCVKGNIMGSDPLRLGEQLAFKLQKEGGREILAEVSKSLLDGK